MNKRTGWLFHLLRTLLFTGAFLVVFALFHHVLPHAADERTPGGRQSMTATGFSAPVSTDAPETAEESWADMFAEHFSGSVIQTESSYAGPGVSITIETVTGEYAGLKQKYTIADVYIADIQNLQTYPAHNGFTTYSADPAVELDKESGAVLAVNGDYCNVQKKGFVVRNGTVYMDGATEMDICVLYYDGTMETYSPGEYEIADILAKEPYQVWEFGPKLLDAEGNPCTQFNTGAALLKNHPRCGIGYYEPGHYCFVVSEGRRKDATGLTMKEFSQLFYDLGCTSAYNLDGGASAVMVFNNEEITRRGEQRGLGDIILIKEVADEKAAP